MTAARNVVNGAGNEYEGAGNDSEGAMKTDDPWVNAAKGMLRAEMTRRGITYEQLAERLAETGAKETPVNLRNKVARGGFSAAFFLQCLTVLGCRSLTIQD